MAHAYILRHSTNDGKVRQVRVQADSISVDESMMRFKLDVHNDLFAGSGYVYGVNVHDIMYFMREDSAGVEVQREFDPNSV